MDTTRRDGEQTPNVAFSPQEKLDIARLLLTEVGVDRIEICSARVSAGEARATQRIARFSHDAGLSERVEALGFCDGDRSAEWLAAAGIRRMNLLVKGSERCTITPGGAREWTRRACSRSPRVARASGCPVPHNAPVVGRDVFTQTAGVHADGDANATSTPRGSLPSASPGVGPMRSASSRAAPRSPFTCASSASRQTRPCSTPCSTPPSPGVIGSGRCHDGTCGVSRAPPPPAGGSR